MSDDNNGRGAADTGQVSVAELLARNGAKVDTQSGGGRRRRGMAGGISVAELTGEIPVVRDETPAPEQTPATDETPTPDEAPAADEPSSDAPAAAPEKPERSAPPTSARPAPVTKDAAARPASAPRIDDRRGEQSARPVPAFGAARSTRPEPALFSGAPSVAVDRLRKSTEERALAPQKPAPQKPAPQKPLMQKPVLQKPAPEVDEDEVTTENDAVTTIVPAVTDAPATQMLADDDESTRTESADVDPAAPEDAEPVAEDAPVAPSKSRSPVKQWLSLIGQGIVAVVLGALLFKGFERLWEMLPWVALVLAFFVIVGLVAVVRVLRRTDDIVSILLAVVVGGFVTLGPLAFMLSTT